MRLIVEVADALPGHVVEGAIDGFHLTGALTLGSGSFPVSPKVQLQAYPNPFTKEIEFSAHVASNSGESVLEIRNLLGQLAEQHTFLNSIRVSSPRQAAVANCDTDSDGELFVQSTRAEARALEKSMLAGN